MPAKGRGSTQQQEKAQGKGYTLARTEPFTTEGGYVIKPLKGREVKVLKGIIDENFDAVKEKLGEVEKQRVQQQKELGPNVDLPADNAAGMAIVEIILDKAFDQAWDFLGSVADVDLDEEPWSAHMDIIEGLVEADDFPNYLKRLMGLSRTFSGVFTTQPSPGTDSGNGS